VNLEAIDDQTKLEERSTFLSTQLTDLATSKQQLEELIDTINKESSVRFEQTFNAVRDNFQSMFRKLFGGGKADLFLETELMETKPKLDADGQPLPLEVKKIDPLDAGIEIIARPPGKQPVSISQLSGGEKAMTCIALLMSIFKSKPSPFCILDEVDAPARRSEQPALRPDRAGIPLNQPLHHHHAPQAHDADRRRPLWRNDAGAGREQTRGGEVRSGRQPGRNLRARGPLESDLPKLNSLRKIKTEEIKHEATKTRRRKDGFLVFFVSSKPLQLRTPQISLGCRGSTRSAGSGAPSGSRSRHCRARPRAECTRV